MSRHLLLTGRPGVGKTTIVERVAATLPAGAASGFVTSEIRDEKGHRLGFEGRALDGLRLVISHVDRRGAPRVGKYGVDVKAVDRLVEAVVSRDRQPRVYLIDEIGKMECFSAAFVRQTRRLLDGEVPVVATVARRGGGFIAEVRERPGCRLVEVTPANRDGLPARILDWLERREGV